MPPPSRKMQRTASTSHYVKTINTARKWRRSTHLRCVGVGAVKAVLSQPEDTVESEGKGKSSSELVAVEEVEKVVYRKWLENIEKDWRAKVEATSGETSTYWSDVFSLIDSLSLADPWSIPWSTFCNKIAAMTYCTYDLESRLSLKSAALSTAIVEWPLTNDENSLPDDEVRYDPALHGGAAVANGTDLACDIARNENGIFDIRCDVFDGGAASTIIEYDRQFTLFPVLPMELQWKIWNFALPNEVDRNGRRIMNVRVHAGDEPKLGHFCLNTTVGTPAFSTTPNVLDVRLLRVSRESRQMFLESFKHELQLPARWKWKRFKVRFTDSTTIYIANFNKVRLELLKAIEDNDELPPYFTIIRKLALDLQQSIPSLSRDDNFYKILVQFKNLKELVIAASDIVCQRFTSKDVLWLEGLEKKLEKAAGKAGKKWKVKKGKFIWTYTLEGR